LGSLSPPLTPLIEKSAEFGDRVIQPDIGMLGPDHLLHRRDLLILVTLVTPSFIAGDDLVHGKHDSLDVIPRL
jgi:hypothetical protein